MVNLNGSRLTDICPSSLADSPEMRAFSEAVGQQIAALCTYADHSRSYAIVDSLDDTMCDMLATELRTPAYLESDSLTIKRALIKNTLVFYETMGTKSAVNAMISAIFGKGETWEWPEYDGAPFHFKVVTTADVSGDARARFDAALAAVKNVRSVLDEVIVAKRGTWNYYTYIEKKTWGGMAEMTWSEASATT